MANSHETRIHNAVNAFEEANASMVRLLEALNDEAARRAPSDGGWNPAQVGYHVAITNELFAGILAGAVPMAKPAPAGFAENPNVFSNVPRARAAGRGDTRRGPLQAQVGALPDRWRDEGSVARQRLGQGDGPAVRRHHDVPGR
jgi:hypothetical protein